MRSILLTISLLLIGRMTHGQPEVDSLRAALSTQPDTTKTLTYAELGWITGQTDLAQGLRWAQTGLALARSIHYLKGEFENLRTLGATYGRRSNYPPALAYFLQALPLAEKMPGSPSLAKVLKNIGMIHSYQREYTKSLSFYTRALQLYRQQNNRYAQADILYDIADVYVHLKQYDKCIGLIRQAMAIYKAEKQSRDYGSAVNLYGYILAQQGRYAEAIPLYQESLRILQADKFDYGVGSSQSGLTDCYFETGDYARAEQVGRQALATLKPTGIWTEIRTAEKNLFRIYTALGDRPKARQHFAAFEAAQDSVYGQQKGQAIAEVQTRYETKLKDQQITGLTRESAVQSQLRNAALVGVGLLLLVVVLLYNRYQLQLNEKRAIEQQRLAERALSRTQQENLQLELDLKHRELASNALLTYQKNEMLGDLKQKVDELLTETEKTQKQKIVAIQKFIQSNLHFEEDWDGFKVPFEQVHPQFFDKLQTHFPDLTPHEQKLCAYTRINLSNKEIARLLNINTSSVEMSRYRLKKKLSLDTANSLTDFIQKF